CDAAAPSIRGPLIPGDEEDPVGSELAEQGRHHTREVAIAGPDGAVVRVVAEIRGDECEGRKPALLEVPLEPLVADHVRAAGAVIPDAAEVHEGVVLLRVGAVLAALEAGARHALHVRLP